MGAWGRGPFEDDTAMDFVDELADCDVDACAKRLGEAILRVARAEDFIDYADGVRAVTAAALLTGMGPSKDAGPWTALPGTDLYSELADDAILAVERAHSPGSHLFELQSAAGGYDEVWASLAPVLSALKKTKARGQEGLF